MQLEPQPLCPGVRILTEAKKLRHAQRGFLRCIFARMISLSAQLRQANQARQKESDIRATRAKECA